MHRFIRLRHRYLYTKTNKLRLRYVVGSAAILSLAMTGFLGSTSSSVAFAPTDVDVAALETGSGVPDFMPLEGVQSGYAESQGDIESVTAPLLRYIEEENLQTLTTRGSEENSEFAVQRDMSAEIAASVSPENMKPREEIIKINSGDTVAGALQEAGASGVEAYRAVKALSKHFDPRDVKPGQAIAIHFEPGKEGMELASINMKLDATKEVAVYRDGVGRFTADLNEKRVVLQTKAAKAVIETSLYGSAARAGIPASVVAEMIRVYSYDVDFQRDIRQGDKVEILYETYETEDGDFARYGDVLYANLMVNGKSMPVYRYEGKDGIVDFYRENGMSLKRILMKTPIDGARMSSGYGMRRHPILGYNKMHKGVDFAAPRGTPIYAAGNGVIEKAGRNGGYGKYIRIRHKNGLKTAYAHMHRFAKNMRVGKRVQQGQIIGYVGTTGRSTGPHLHFEVLRNGKQVNPNSIKSSTGTKLTGAVLKDFQQKIVALQQLYAILAQDLKFAHNTISE